MKEKLFRNIADRRQNLAYMADKIFDNPEHPYEEYKASDLLCKHLKEQGFLIERGIAQLKTAFKATWTNGHGGPTISFLCEYDALPLLGHACGHHLQGPAAIGAALAVKESLREYPFTVIVYGTPAEESTGGKIQMLNEGCFRETDVALACHAGRGTSSIGGGYKSLKSFLVTFKGISAHASGAPHEGRSALDAMILSFNGIEFMREHVKDECRMHYTVREATGPSNIVHEKAIALYTLRANDDDYLDKMKLRFDRIIKGATLMTDTAFEMKVNASYSSGIVLDSLSEVGLENLKLVDKKTSLVRSTPSGSSDFGNVSKVVPGLMIYSAYCNEPSHTQAWVDTGKTDAAYCSMLNSAKTMAGVAYDLITDSSLIASIKQELDHKTQNSQVR